ncbi:MAG: DUF2283 domain-containing protein [Armatimonadota bacterium]|nr:DUF2283 domain-containing protein [Armatimonadota bacterium]MDR7548385.1 DUF2283 domain-containing protein [Armatimonadota bacterium]
MRRFAIFAPARSDALSVTWTEEKSETGREVAPGVIMSFDRTGRPVSFELLQTSAQIGRAGLGQIELDLRHLPLIAS